MAFDKTKVVRAAEKYLAQGKIPAAIKEYRIIVEHDPADFTALNMLGDLHVRAGNKDEASTAFTRIAEHYREQGFALKAIAMYKKIDRLQPGSIEIANKLASLYEIQGLLVDARAQYLVVADALARTGHSQKALEVLRKVADLDQNNVEIRLRLAEGYMRENLRTDAGKAYATAGAQLFARNQPERALDALTKALSVDPRDKESLSHLVGAHIALGTADEAAEVLEAAVVEQPGNVELLSLLTTAYIEAEDAPAAERAAIALCTQESSAYLRFADVARLYLHQGDVNAAARTVSVISEQMLNGREEEELLRLLNEVLARDPEQLDALRLMVRVHTWQHDDDKLRRALEQLVEAAEAAGHAEEERHALSQLVRLAPEEARYRERLQDLGGAPESDETSYANDTSYTATQMAGDVPTFESFMPTNDQSFEISAPETAAAVEASSDFEWNTIASPAATPATAALTDPSTSFADISEGWADTSEASAKVSVDSPTPPNSFQEFDFGSAVIEPPASTDSAAPASAVPSVSTSSDARREEMLRQELESVDFYLAQGYTDIARDTLEMLERQFGAHAEIDARRAQLQTAAPPAGVASTAHDIPVPQDASKAATETVDFSGFSLYDPAQEATAAAPAAATIDDVDAAFMSLESSPQTAAPPPTSVAVPVQPDAPPQNLIDPGLAAIFDEFRTGMEADDPAVSNGDYETHYNLGLAYKEMDLLDEAIEEFQTAAGIVAPRDGTPRYLQCCNLLGHCFMQKGMQSLAVMWFKKGLDSPGHTEDEYQALRFELGLAFEGMGELDKAIDTFTEVYGNNVSYRGVADKLRELQAQRATK